MLLGHAGFGLYCGLGAGMDLAAALAGSLLHLTLLPNFDNPYGATTCEPSAQGGAAGPQDRASYVACAGKTAAHLPQAPLYFKPRSGAEAL